MNCSKLIGDRSRFYLHCLTPSSSRFGVTSGACSVACFSTNSEAPQAPLFNMKHATKHISLARARARAVFPGKCIIMRIIYIMTIMASICCTQSAAKIDMLIRYKMLWFCGPKSWQIGSKYPPGPPKAGGLSLIHI